MPATVPLPPGLFVPTAAFFRDNDTVDEAATAHHVLRLIHSGAVAGIVVHGSNGEAVHLDRAERRLITRVTRQALDSARNPDDSPSFSPPLPLIVGCSAQSTRETLQLCADAAADGGTHALVLPPAYYASLLSRNDVLKHFTLVADASPVPLIVYNYPAASGGLDLTSDELVVLSCHPNIVGAKLTCGNTGKLARVVAATRAMPGRTAPFRTFGGSADFILQTLAVGGDGVIAGLANIAPRACAEIIRLWERGDLNAAREKQALVAKGDWVAIQGGFVAVKVALQQYYGYGGLPRLPCVRPAGERLVVQQEGFAELVELERNLEGGTKQKAGE